MFGVQLLFYFFVFTTKTFLKHAQKYTFYRTPVYTQVINLLEKAKIKQLSRQTIGSEKYVKRLDGGLTSSSCFSVSCVTMILCGNLRLA